MTSRAPDAPTTPLQVSVRGLVSKFAVGYGRSGTDRQFFYVNGRPCDLSKVYFPFLSFPSLLPFHESLSFGRQFN
jgi:hypothetical protein